MCCSRNSRLAAVMNRAEEEEEEEFIQNRTRAGARFLTRWDQHAGGVFEEFWISASQIPPRACKHKIPIRS